MMFGSNLPCTVCGLTVGNRQIRLKVEQRKRSTPSSTFDKLFKMWHLNKCKVFLQKVSQSRSLKILHVNLCLKIGLDLCLNLTRCACWDITVEGLLRFFIGPVCSVAWFPTRRAEDHSIITPRFLWSISPYSHWCGWTRKTRPFLRDTKTNATRKITIFIIWNPCVDQTTVIEMKNHGNLVGCAQNPV